MSFQKENSCSTGISSFEISFHYVTPVGLELMILLLQPPECWNYGYAAPTMSWFSTGTIHYSQSPSLLHLLHLWPKCHHLYTDPTLLLYELIYAFPSAWNVVFSIWKFAFHPSEPRTDVTFFVKSSLVFLIIMTLFICIPIAYIHT